MTETRTARPKTSGAGRTLIVFYFIMTIAALARSIFEIVSHFSVAPLAYLLSLFAGIVYLIATIALVTPGRPAFRVAQIAITIELVGVLVVGALSVVDLSLFPFSGDRSTVWAYFGLEYLLIPLALPILGLLFLRSQRAVFAKEA
ncbi:membrane protein [Amnibacterium soli]|uniref:Membrane protein n=1 Tax=Amnibacterium soli TaxID=1282736 RepID=A0ABP8YWA3_9MICO